jgi:hypothetical protein
MIEAAHRKDKVLGGIPIRNYRPICIDPSAKAILTTGWAYHGENYAS